ncbi:MAG TPA: helix-turn-helix transcriptional regulator [Nocardioidaceae bacterium]|nr:helix-turn-helix transcriptional regulator [Nocardioidaceae bacterium]
MEPVLEFVDAPTTGPLDGVADSMVGYRATGQRPSLHRGVPSPSLTFIVNLDTPIVAGTHAHADRDGTARAYDNIVGGLHLEAAYLFQPDRQAGIQLGINPLRARALFGVPAAELADTANDAESVVGTSLNRLRDRVGNEPDWSARFDLVRRYLLDRLGVAPSFTAPRTEVAAAWRWMLGHGGCGRMDDLSRHVHLSGRQLSKLFRAELGVTPKAVNRLIRFHRARTIIQEHAMAGGLSISDVAHATGYYDHAHLTREFGEFLGCSPSAWLSEEFENIQAGGHHQAAGLMHE